MKKIWHDKAHKEYSSDSNALRRLYDDMKREDGYNDQMGKLMFRCADEMDRLTAENEKLVKALQYVKNNMETDEQLEGIDFANELYEINTALAIGKRSHSERAVEFMNLGLGIHSAFAADACMNYRHDYGLLSGDEQTALRWTARFWLEAWSKAILEPSKATMEALDHAEQATDESDEEIQKLEQMK